jgi:hypothetical protein
MPQLDLFTIQSQFICLVISIFIIYNFLLKYAISSFDAYCRLKIKKINYFKTQNAVLSFFSSMLRKKTSEYIAYLAEGVNDISKILSKKVFFELNSWYHQDFIKRVLEKSLYKQLTIINNKIIITMLLKKLIITKNDIIQKLLQNTIKSKKKSKSSLSSSDSLKAILDKKLKKLYFFHNKVLRKYIVLSFQLIDSQKYKGYKKDFIDFFKKFEIKTSNNVK